MRAGGRDVLTRLAHLIARAAPPMERGDATLYEPAADTAIAAAKRLAAWKVAVGGGVPGAFDAWLDSVGLDEAQFACRVAPVLLIDPDRLPPWGMVFANALDLMPVDPGEAPMAATFALIDPWLTAARRMLQVTIETHMIAPSAIDGMLVVLRTRLWQALGGILEYEVRAARVGFGSGRDGFDGGREAWIDRLERFPAAVWLIGVSIGNWLTLMREIVARLAADADVIAAKFFDGRRQGRLIAFRGDAGDVHNHGRAVALLTFEGGARLVYKPKDLRASAAFVALVEALNGVGLDHPLDAGCVLPREEYAWERFVVPTPCGDAGGPARFYHRMGALIRLFQLLEGRDLWLDNLIAAGDQPVFIDLETLLQPRLPSRGLTATERAARRALAETVVELGTVTMPTPIEPGIACEELGALAPARPYLSPFRKIPGSTGFATREDFVRWDHPEHVPTHEGVSADPAEYLTDVLAGYRGMQTALARAAPLLRAENGLLAALRSAPVRYICRDTWSCQKLIQQSCSPALLADPVLRERYLAQLQRAVLADDLDAASRRRHRAIIASEIDAIRELDVPFFVSHPDSDGVGTVTGATIRGHFDGTAWDRLLARLVTIADFPSDQHEAVLMSTYGAAHRDVPAPRIVVARGDEREPLEEAQAIGEALLGAGARIGDDPPVWQGLVYSPYIDGWTVEPVHADLLSGSGALAILFADLHAACGGTRWRDATLAALAATDRALASVPGQWNDLAASATRRAVPPYVGAFIGTGSDLFVRRYCRARLALPEDDPLAGTPLPLDPLFRVAAVDTVGGLAGLLFALVADPRHRIARADEIARLVAHLATMPHDLNGRIAQPHLPSGARMLDGLPDASAAFALALHRLGERRPRLCQLSGPCTGDRLAALGRGEVVPLAGGGAPLDTVEIGLTAHALTGAPAHLAAARKAIDVLRERHRRTGKWFPETCRSDIHDLSPVRGTVAVARALIGTAQPELWRSVRLHQVP